MLDVDARRALEGRRRAREGRRRANEGAEAKRRRAMDDLESRERAAAGREGGAAADAARGRLREELARARRRREPEGARERGGDDHADGDDGRDGGAATTTAERLHRALKVVWRRDGDGDADAYSAKALRGIFEAFGIVEDVVVREGKKKKGSALVVFENVEACERAARASCGRVSNPLVTTRAATPRAGDDAPSGATASVDDAARTETTQRDAAPVGAANLDFESAVLERLKRAQERARLVAEAEAEDDAT